MMVFRMADGARATPETDGDVVSAGERVRPLCPTVWDEARPVPGQDAGSGGRAAAGSPRAPGSDGPAFLAERAAVDAFAFRAGEGPHISCGAWFGGAAGVAVPPSPGVMAGDDPWATAGHRAADPWLTGYALGALGEDGFLF